VVTVTFRRDSLNRLSSVISKGHADLALHGDDVACAAVSAILQAVLLGLTEVAKIAVAAKVAPGHMIMAWAEAERDRADVNAIVATAELSIESIAHDYAANVRLERAAEP
jgi:uncharacterized protein YsxB (DUF464 family)